MKNEKKCPAEFCFLESAERSWLIALFVFCVDFLFYFAGDDGERECYKHVRKRVSGDKIGFHQKAVEHESDEPDYYFLDVEFLV